MGKLEEAGGGGGGGVAAAQQGGQLTGARLGSGAAAPEGRVGVNLNNSNLVTFRSFQEKYFLGYFFFSGKFSCHTRASIEYSRLNLSRETVFFANWGNASFPRGFAEGVNSPTSTPQKMAEEMKYQNSLVDRSPEQV